MKEGCLFLSFIFGVILISFMYIKLILEGFDKLVIEMDDCIKNELFF